MDYPMHPDLKIGSKFPNFELPNEIAVLCKVKPSQTL